MDTTTTTTTTRGRSRSRSWGRSRSRSWGRSRSRSRSRSWGRFVLHYVEMVIAMYLGMALLHPVAMSVLDAVGRPELMTIPETGALIMATTMAVPMVVPMLLRGHGWRHVLEMSATMYLPFVVLFVPMWLGLITVPEMFRWGHLLMLPAMAGVMLLRRDEHAHRRVPPAPLTAILPTGEATVAGSTSARGPDPA